MTKTHKKYNIWVAYSDLFTNLSTFLFISAVGVFAGLGSGILDSPGAGGSAHCKVPASLDASLTAHSSILTPLGPGPDGCTRYYRIGTFRYRYSATGSGEFKDDDGNILSPAKRLDGVCTPVWLTITRRDFGAARGRLAFQGISTSDNGWKYQPECKKLASVGPRINHPLFPAKKSAFEVIQACDKPPHTAYPALCPLIRACNAKAEEDRNTLCQEVEAARKWEAHVPAACLKDVAQQHARELYKLCELAPIDPTFQDHRFQSEAVDVKARRIDGRPAFWETRVDYSVPLGGTIRLARDARRASRPIPPGGSIVLELKFQR